MAEEVLTVLRIDGDPASLTVRQLQENIKRLKKELSDLAIGSAEYQKTLQALITNQNALRGAMNATTASMTDVAKAASGMTKAYENESGQVENLATTYNGLVNQLANLKRELRNVDISTTEGMETYKAMAVQVNAVNDKLKEMDALQGNYQRNVGNYRSALNGLNNATAQVVRELPSLAISANTFFLAISNNIPILADQIANLRAQNELAVAQGGKAVSILGSLVKSLFSWNTVLTLVITAVTLFGDKIIAFVGNLFKAKEAVDVNTEALKAYQHAVNEAVKAEREAITTSSLLYEIATDETRSMEDRLSAVHQLQEEYPDYLGNMSDEAVLAGKAKTAYDKLTESLVENARAKAYLSTITEKQSEIVDIEIKRADAFDKLTEAQTRYNNAVEGLEQGQQEGKMSTELQYFVQSAEAASKQISDLNEEIAGYNDQIAVIDKTIQNLSKNIPVDYITTDSNGNGGGGTDDEPQDNTLEYVRRMQDEQIALMEDGYAKQLMVSRLHYEREIEDLKTTLETEENLTEEGRAAINETIRALTEQGEQEQTRILQEWEQEKQDIYQETLDEIIKDNEAFSRELDKQEAEAQRRIERAIQRQQRFTEGMNEAKLQRVDKDSDHALAMNDSTTGQSEWERQENEYNIIQEANQKKLELLRQFEQDALDAKNPQLAIQYQQQAADMEVEIEENAAARKKKVWEDEKNAKMATLMGVANGTASILDSMADMYEADAENSEKSAQQAKNLRIASATIETITGAIGAFMQASASYPPPYGQILGAVQAAVVLATGMAQIAKIKNTEVNKDSTPSGSVSGISATVSAPTITPEVTQVRNVTSASEEDRLNRMADDQRVYILSSDLEANQNQRRVRIRETSF